LLGENAAREFGALHPTALAHYWTQFGDFSTVHSDCDDFAGIDTVEQSACIRAEFSSVDNHRQLVGS
jgi:hypothetical protein